MIRHPISVECYAGSRADETPRRISIGGREHVVARLLAESVEEQIESPIERRRYRVLTEGRLVLEVVRTSESNWYLEMKNAD